MKVSKQDKLEAIESLQRMLNLGQTIYTVLRSVSSSGMSRSISAFTIDKKGELISLDWYLSRALGLSRHRKNNGLVTTGAGMDMGFDLVYRTGRVVFPDGLSPAKKDGGYAFKQQWL